MTRSACNSPCKVQNCINLVGQKGARHLCTKHYQMWRLTGDPCGTTAPTEAERFWRKVEKGPGCWTWKAAKDGNGYGLFRTSRMTRAHRWAYESLVGPIPDGLVLDHLCRNPSCVNPEHLEPVTNDENLSRGWGRRIKNGMANACINGHEYNDINTYKNLKGALVCRTCAAESRRRYQQKAA